MKPSSSTPFPSLLRLLALILPATIAPPVAVASAGGEPDGSGSERYSRGSWVGTATAGLVDSLDQDRDIQIYDGRFAAGYYFRDGLAVVGELYAAAIDGSRRLEDTDEMRQVSSTGLGGALLLRWHFLNRQRWSSFLDLGWGLLLTDDEFPPGGTELNGTRQYGLGLTYRVSDRLHLTFGARQLHVSNGRGIVDDNPSYDGIGTYLGSAFRLGHRSVAEPERSPAPLTERRQAENRFGTRVEGQVGDFDGDRYLGSLVDFDVRLHGRWWTQLELAVADIGGETLTELGLSAYRRGRRGLVAASVSRQELDVFTSHRVILQKERDLNDLTTIVGVAGWEERNLDSDRWLGALRLRLHATPNLLVEPGLVLIDDLRSDFDSSDIEPSLHLEIQPRPLRKMGASFFLEDRDELLLAGIRLTTGRQTTLRHRYREGGLYRARF